MDMEAEFIAAFRRYVTSLGSDPDVSDRSFWELLSKHYWETTQAVATIRLNKRVDADHSMV